jgi:hypothetical protein
MHVEAMMSFLLHRKPRPKYPSLARATSRPTASGQLEMAFARLSYQTCLRRDTLV